MNVDGLVDLVASRSVALTADDASRRSILDAVRAIGEEVAGPDGWFELPYVTRAFRATRP